MTPCTPRPPLNASLHSRCAERAACVTLNNIHLTFYDASKKKITLISQNKYLGDCFQSAYLWDFEAPTTDANKSWFILSDQKPVVLTNSQSQQSTKLNKNNRATTPQGPHALQTEQHPITAIGCPRVHFQPPGFLLPPIGRCVGGNVSPESPRPYSPPVTSGEGFRRGGGGRQRPLRLWAPSPPLWPMTPVSRVPSDHGDRVRETLGPQEGHERDLQGEVPSHPADAQQNPEVKK